MNGLVLEVVWTIHTTVHAIVRQVERSEHHDTVAIKLLLDVAGQLVDAFYQVCFFALQEYGGFSVRQSLAKSSFLYQLLDEGAVILVFAGIFQRFQYLGVADEFFRDS